MYFSVVFPSILTDVASVKTHKSGSPFSTSYASIPFSIKFSIGEGPGSTTISLSPSNCPFFEHATEVVSSRCVRCNYSVTEGSFAEQGELNRVWLYKGREDVEQAFDAMKNELESDKTYLRSIMKIPRSFERFRSSCSATSTPPNPQLKTTTIISSNTENHIPILQTKLEPHNRRIRW